MARASLSVCTLVGFTLLLAGCASTDVAGLLMFKNTGQNGDRVIAGNVQAVALTTTTSLARFGMKATMTPKGNDVWISSQTVAGAKFNMILTSEKTVLGGERTHIRIQWESQRDEQTGTQVLADVEARHKN